MIIAIDPGKVSGLALWDERHPLTIHSHEETPISTVDYVASACNIFTDVTVVTEKFTISERTIKTALSLDALDINGWLTIESPRMGFDLHFQMPSQAKAFSTDEKLKALDWYERTKDGHANDAARHLLVYLITKVPSAREALLPSLARIILPS